MNWPYKLAIIVLVVSSMVIVLRVIGRCRYTLEQEAWDAIHGMKRTFPIGWPLVAWILAFGWIAFSKS